MLILRYRTTDPLVEKHSETEYRLKELCRQCKPQFKTCANSGFTLPCFGEARSDRVFLVLGAE